MQVHQNSNMPPGIVKKTVFVCVHTSTLYARQPKRQQQNDQFSTLQSPHSPHQLLWLNHISGLQQQSKILPF